MMPSLDRLLRDTLDDPRRAALLGAAKGAVLGVALGKLALGITFGAAAGAGTALLLRLAARRLMTMEARP